MEGEAFRALQARELPKHLLRQASTRVAEAAARIRERNAQNGATFGTTPRKAYEQGFALTHENGVPVAEILRMAPSWRHCRLYSISGVRACIQWCQHPECAVPHG